jgi:hypothetical protein
MDAFQPRVRVVQRQCAPRTYPCPQCGKRGRRKATYTRPVRDIAYGEILILEVTIGEYRARCSCCKTFRSQVPGIEARAEYTNRVREAVIGRVLEDNMSMQRVRASLQRECYLDLSQGFLYDCLDWKVRQLDLAEYRRWTLTQFSGTLCVDEIHLGHRTLLVATDPLRDIPIAFALVSANDQAYMGRFLHNLKTWGFDPQVVVTDGSNLYPKLLANLWPKARHQLCVFHVLQDINKHVLDAVRRLRRQHAACGGRRRRRGQPRKSERTTRKEQAYFVWKHRYLLVTRPEHLTGRQRRQLTQLFTYIPELKLLRRFVLQVHRVFDPANNFQNAAREWARLVTTPEYQADPDLNRAMAMLSEEKFEKMIAYLSSPLGQRVRTNNHVERTNRRLRYLEKVRYKWRRRRTIVRFVALALERWWRQQRQASPEKPPGHCHTTRRKPSSPQRKAA